MMILPGSETILRPAGESDRNQLRMLLQRKSFVHRHLDWRSPFYWLGKQPFFLREDQRQDVLAALACPPDDAGLIWLRLFAAAPGYPLQRAWQGLWPAAREWLAEHLPGAEVNSLAVIPEMEELLLRSNFQEISQVVSLVWDVSSARWPEAAGELEIREMTPPDLLAIQEIDRVAFLPLWRNTLAELQAAFSSAYYASVGLLGGRIAGYQISTANPQGGHLARLAVAPQYQGQGLGIKLVDDLLERLSAGGIVEVTVNTQAENQRSLALYRKFGFKSLEVSLPVLRYTIESENEGPRA